MSKWTLGFIIAFVIVTSTSANSLIDGAIRHTHSHRYYRRRYCHYHSYPLDIHSNHCVLTCPNSSAQVLMCAWSTCSMVWFAILVCSTVCLFICFRCCCCCFTNQLSDHLTAANTNISVNISPKVTLQVSIIRKITY